MQNNRFIVSPKPLGKGNSEADITVIILASPPIYRMRTYGPIPLIQIDNECLLDIITEQVSLAFPKAEVILTIGFEANRVVKAVSNRIRLVENQLYEETNLTEDLRLGLNNCTTNKALIINGNCVLNADSFKQINVNESSIFIENKGILPKNSIGITQSDGCVNNFAYGIENKWCEIAFVTGKEMELLKMVTNATDRKRLFLFESLNLVLEKAGQFKVIEPTNLAFTKVDSPNGN